jgi:hypothetical protein
MAEATVPLRRAAMRKPGEINHIPGTYRSECCGIERTLADNGKFPPCPGPAHSSENPCAGKNATWTSCGRRR